MSTSGEKLLLWSENFQYQSALEFEKFWNYDQGDGSQYGLTGWGNNELEYYTKDSISYNEGLIISAKKLNPDSGLKCYYGPALWQSGKIHSANKVSIKYGLIEIVAKAPVGVGTWPALWLLGNNLLQGVIWPNCGEIDILETTGAHANRIQGTLHGPRYFGEAGLTKIIEAEHPLSDGYHTYSINWMEDRFEWYFDGQLYSCINRNDYDLDKADWPFDQEFYLILNLAIGGWFAGEVDPNLTEAQFSVESIKFFSVNGIGSITFN